MADAQRTVGLVLAGGGARGAYEMGALSVLLPALEDRGERPRVLVGTSVGALNTAFLAGTAELEIPKVIALGLGIWDEISFKQVLRCVRSPGTLGRVASYAGQFLHVPGARLDALLDPAPLKDTLYKRVPIEQIQDNVRSRHLDAAAVVATSAATSRSVVFHCGGSSPPRDDRRAIDYVETMLADEHVRASAAIPGLFPAVQVRSPERARGWYFDGGTQLNTPIKPAIQLGAGRIVVVALNSIETQPERLASEERPDVFQGAYQLLQGLLAAPLAHDMATLAGINELIGASGTTVPGRDLLPYIFIAPTTPYAIGQIAYEVFNRYYPHLLKALLGSEVAFLGRAVAGGADPIHGELLSYLFFAPEFARELIKLGREDAQRWLDAHPPNDPWETGPLHVARA